MDQYLRPNTTEPKNCVNVSRIGNDEYLIESSTPEAKFICENTEYDFSLVDIKDGPKIIVGKDFFGHGCVDHISVLRIDPKLPLLLKIKLIKY